MGEGTIIAWTDHTFNPWMGCLKISPGCANCYAERQTRDRMGLRLWGPASTTKRQRTSAANWKKPVKYNREAEAAGKPAKVFCGSLCDWAEDHPQLDACRADLWDLIRATPWLQWQLLTKRADRIKSLLPPDWGKGYPNVWLGVSVEDQEHADKRIPLLLELDAVVHFISYEPALGPLSLRPSWILGYDYVDGLTRTANRLDWIIIGGESGPGYRPMPHEWARTVRGDCRAVGVPFFFKQSAAPRTEMGTQLDGETVREYPNPPAPGMLL